jgi:hypothetical protein
MSQFTRKSWWALVLIFALTLSSVSFVMVPAVAHAIDEIDEPTGGGGGGGSTGFGDPDVPTGIARQSLPEGSGRGVMIGSARVAGDGGELSNPRMWRLQTLVVLMRGFLFRF